MELIRKLDQLIPCSPDGKIDWEPVEGLFAAAFFSRLRDVPQDPLYHGEGNVMAHTRMVCEALIRTVGFHELPMERKTALFLAALLHDIGKAGTTRQENGVWISPNHSPAGSRMARTFLWKDEQLCGSPEALRFRETVCALIRYHMLPGRIPEQNNPERSLRRLAAVGELAPDFTLDQLCMLAEADAGGRIAGDRAEILSRIQLCRMMAEEAGCLSGPYPFPDACTRHAYLNGRNVSPDHSLYDDTWGEVILLSGLPGTGKDTRIRGAYAGLPVVSLDGIRKKLRISPADNQSRVAEAAREEAREYLRGKQPFVWNATNLSPEIREKVTGLFERYGARVRILYLEAAWEKRAARNAGRKDSVPETAVVKMLGKAVPPMPYEARTVEWECV